MFVDRDAEGRVSAAYAARQRPDQEELPDPHPDLDPLLRPPPTRSEHPLRMLARIVLDMSEGRAVQPADLAGLIRIEQAGRP